MSYDPHDIITTLRYEGGCDPDSSSEDAMAADKGVDFARMLEANCYGVCQNRLLDLSGCTVVFVFVSVFVPVCL